MSFFLPKTSKGLNATMGNFTKWCDTTHEPSQSNNELHGIMFVARNKDNQTLTNFTERRSVFLTTKPANDPQLIKLFTEFAKRGQPNELSRMYVSVNKRDQKGTRIGLLHYTLDHVDTVNTAALQTIIVKIAMSHKNATEKKRMFDFDSNDPEKVKEFVADLKQRQKRPGMIKVYQTIHGYAVIIERGIDLRKLVDTMPNVKQKDKKDKGPWKWNKDIVSYKIDDFILTAWYQNDKLTTTYS